MVKVKITNQGFVATGHADYDKMGYDIVCSAISALTQSIALSLRWHCKAKVEHISNGMIVEVSKSDKSILLLDTLRLGMLEIEKEYKDHVRVETMRGVFK